MSQENVEIVRALQPSGVDFVAAFNADLATFAGAASGFSDDFEAVFIDRRARTTIGPYRGIAGFVEGWRDWLEPWERYELRAERFIDVGDQVVVFARVSGRTRRDGVEMDHAPAAVYTLRDGLVSRIEFYLDRDEALRTVGLKE
jgi:ketosteroid isomerase-like protein